MKIFAIISLILYINYFNVLLIFFTMLKKHIKYSKYRHIDETPRMS